MTSAQIRAATASVTPITSAPSKSWWKKTLHIVLGLGAKLVGAVWSIIAGVFRAIVTIAFMAALAMSWLLVNAKLLPGKLVEAVKAAPAAVWSFTKTVSRVVARTPKAVWSFLKNPMAHIRMMGLNPVASAAGLGGTVAVDTAVETMMNDPRIMELAMKMAFGGAK